MSEELCFNHVRKMHEKFELDHGKPARLGHEEREFRIACLQEELDEFKNSTSLVDDYDAMLDLIVFALGTIHRMGLPFYTGFQAVMDANMTKELGPNAKRGGFKNDLVKPDDFVGPEDALKQIISNSEFDAHV